MSALAASSVYDSVSGIGTHSQIANVSASPEFRRTADYAGRFMPHIADMADDDDKNGGPNHLGAWMRYRNVKGVTLAKALGGRVTPGMVSDLMNSKRALSAKWLRRIAPLLKTTPGMLLDHDPYELDRDLVEFWTKADDDERKQIVGLARVVVKDRTGTEGA